MQTFYARKCAEFLTNKIQQLTSFFLFCVSKFNATITWQSPLPILWRLGCVSWVRETEALLLYFCGVFIPATNICRWKKEVTYIWDQEMIINSVDSSPLVLLFVIIGKRAGLTWTIGRKTPRALNNKKSMLVPNVNEINQLVSNVWKQLAHPSNGRVYQIIWRMRINISSIIWTHCPSSHSSLLFFEW